MGPLKKKLVGKPAANKRELATMIIEYIKEDDAEKLTEEMENENRPRVERPRSPKRERVWYRLQKPNKKQRMRSSMRANGRIRKPQEPLHAACTPLSKPIGCIYAQMDKSTLPIPRKLKAPPH
ncbi:hypothetical protein LIER_24703 [Lithospermum erythrorhizon]|uniref:Uncharacterized protein n=1 Tax=Lithospermum erythrorhizon TaxID=34254 RepID=A0AAV3R216_LITER